MIDVIITLVSGEFLLYLPKAVLRYHDDKRTYPLSTEVKEMSSYDMFGLPIPLQFTVITLSLRGTSWICSAKCMFV